MFSKNLRKKSFSDEEEESDLIINNDEFCTLNESKGINENLFQLKTSQQSKNSNTEKKNDFDYNQNNKILLKNPKVPKLTVDNIFSNNNIDNINNNDNLESHKSRINNNEEKTIFSKITEDLYIDSLNNIKPKKDIFDVYNNKDDNYNKLTVENYLFTCADKENSRNQKIINDFIERKNKEQICKKISIMQKNNKNGENAEKKYSSDHTKRKRSKGSRSPEQFLDDQRNLEKKHKNYIDKLIQIHNEEINLCLKDRPTISKYSIKLANMNKNKSKNIYVKLYEEFKKKNIEEKNKNTFIYSEYESGINKKLDNEQIIENTKRLHKEYEKKKNAINENKLKQINDIKNLSSYSLMNKNSNDIMSKRFISIYKNALKELFDKKISDNFDVSFRDFLLFIYKLGLVDKDYSVNIKIKEKFKPKLMNLDMIENPIKSDSIEEKNQFKKTEINKFTHKKREEKNNIKLIRGIFSEEEKNRKNRVDFSNKVLKKNTFSKTKSVGKKSSNNIGNIFGNETEFKLAKEAWKIITKNKSFNEELLASSNNIFLFFLSLCGIYKGTVNDIFIKKEFPFLLNDKSELFNIVTSKYIYKYFNIYRKSIIDNTFEKIKSKKKEPEIRNIELKKYKINSKSFIKKSCCTNFHKDKYSLIKKKKKVLNISKDKVEFKSFFNIKNKLSLNSNSNIENNDNNNNEKIKKFKKLINKDNVYKNKNINTGRYHNKLIKDFNNNFTKTDDNEKKELMFKRNLKKINQNDNSKSSFTSNSIFTQNVFEPQINKKDTNNLEKSNNGGHLNEKKSSISQYIFNEDYRIKDDIESNSNFNDNEINKEKSLNNNLSGNIENDNNNNKDYIINNRYENNGHNENINKDSEMPTVSLGGKKKKFIFKIKIKDDLIKLVINKGDDINYKINEFCKENNLDEDDKEQIIEAVNYKLLGKK